jgi:hypothetical protein
MNEVKSNVAQIVATSPSHLTFLQAYCPTGDQPN